MAHDTFSADEFEMQKTSITARNSRDKDLHNLPSKRDLGSKPEIKKGSIEIRIGSRPMVRHLGKLYELSGRTLPPELEVLTEHANGTGYDLYLVTHAVSVVKIPGWQNVTYLNFQVTYPDHPCVSVVDVAPQRHYVKKFEIISDTNIGAKYGFSAGLDLTGHFAALPESGSTNTDAKTDAADSNTQADPLVIGPFGFKVDMKQELRLVGNLRFNVMTPVIDVVGKGDTYSHWAFSRYDDDLTGDFLMVQTLLVPKGIGSLDYTATVGATITTFDLLPDKRNKRIKSSFALPQPKGSYFNSLMSAE